ncbi:MAG: hypothetical protein L3K19_02285 [Thermoplasmata archaeon]|nr:hypothetical protein [Thermoplasmata archaeon]
MSVVIPTLNGALAPYVLLAAIMVGANLYLLTRTFPRQGGTPHFGTIVLVVGILLMTAVLWLALIDAVLDPGDSSTVAVFVAGNSMMGVFGAWMIAVFYRAEEKRLPPSGWQWPTTFALLVVGSELLMGIAYVLALGGASQYVAGGEAGFVSLLRDSVGSVWFAFAMLANMLLLITWLPFPRVERVALGGLAASTGLAPWIIAGSPAAVAAMGAIMGGVLGVGIFLIVRSTSTTVRSVETLEGVAAGFALMMGTGLAGLAIPGLLGGTFLFALGTLVVMGGELVYIGRWALARPVAAPTPADPTASDRTPTAVVGS